jgi:putative tricarboxylic transport membrane protein
MVCNLGNLVIGTFSIKVAKNVLRVPHGILYPVILMLCFVGTYAVDNSMFDVQAMFFFGVLGYLMRKFNYPLAPLLIAFVLGPMLENAMRQAMIIADGRVNIFFTRPISLAFLLITTVTIVIMTVKIMRSRKNDDPGSSHASYPQK